MSLLLVDAGNARLKWAVYDEQRMGPVFAGSYDDADPDVFDRLAAAVDGGVEAVVVGNVAGPGVRDRIHRAVAGAEGTGVWFASSRRETAGVLNGYAEPASLGIDRWAAIVAAWRHSGDAKRSAPICVVDAGTALTIDGIAEGGEHLGGLILPGLQLQRTALFVSTSGIAPAARNGLSDAGLNTPFGRSTAAALAMSGPLACAAAVDRCVEYLAAPGVEPQLMLTGGDAADLAPWLASRFEICPNLVFEGLAILFEQERSS